MMRSIVAGKVMIYLLGYVVAKINQDVSVQRSMVWQLTSVVWGKLTEMEHRISSINSAVFCVIYCVANR